MSGSPSNHSKALAGADDSAARFLVELLGGSPGRNFDLDSIFVERTKEGTWKWWIFEFLKRENPKVSVASSHPNRYWHKNGRKFLSLWTVVMCFRKAGFEADLVLVNYDDAREKVKWMVVEEIRPDADDDWEYGGRPVAGTRNRIRTKDRVMPFAEFQKRFQKFNDRKKGETWELLAELQRDGAA